MTPATDRPAAIRRALCNLVAHNGFHGASMSAVAQEAGVATGTAYVHYASKQDLVYATYLEIKRDLGDAVLGQVNLDADPRERYRQLWIGIYRYLQGEPERARFLTQLEESPFHESAHEMLAEEGDRLLEEGARADLEDLFVDLPMAAVHLLSAGTAVRLVSAGIALSDEEVETFADATWRAIAAPQ